MVIPKEAIMGVSEMPILLRIISKPIPNCAENHYIYVYSASTMTPPATKRVIRLSVNDDFTEVSNRADIVDDIPYKPQATDHPFADAGAHNGGRLKFGPDDRYFYVTTGNNHNSELPQSPESLCGKVLRIERDGEVAPVNGYIRRVRAKNLYLWSP